MAGEAVMAVTVVVVAAAARASRVAWMARAATVGVAAGGMVKAVQVSAWIG
jgi:hypothetical protein